MSRLAAFMLCFVVVVLAPGCKDSPEKVGPTDSTGSDSSDADSSTDARDTADTENDTPDVPIDVTLDQDMGPTPPDFGPRTIVGQWWAGDFHVHATGASNDTGGDSLPTDIKQVAVQRGLDFVVLTDHSNSTGSDPSTTDEDPMLFNQGPEFPYWDAAAMLSDANFLMIDGNEISPRDPSDSVKVGHVGCYPRDLNTFDPLVAFVDRPMGDVNGSQTIAQARSAGCFVTINHPYAITDWIAFDWTETDYDALEVFNGAAGWDTGDGNALLAWACDLSQGQETVLLGGSDNHRVFTEPPSTLRDSVLGMPTTWVWATELTWPSLLSGLDAQQVTVGDTGVPLELDVYDAEGQWMGMPGSTVGTTDIAWIRLRGAVQNNNTDRMLRVVRVLPNTCTDARTTTTNVPEVPLEIIYERRLGADESFDSAVPVSLTGPGHLFATVLPRSDGLLGAGVAMTNAITLE